MGYRRLCEFVIAALLPLCGGLVHAADAYPSKPIRLIVPYAPGGGTDISARALAQHMGQILGQSVIVENRPGAGTLVGTAFVAKAAPDGYTLVYGSVTHTIAPALYKSKMPFDAVKDFTPISQVATFPFVFLVQPASKIGSIQQLVTALKAKPGALNYASVGNGTGTNLSGEMFKLMTHTNMAHVPYNGSGPAITALLGGQVQVAISDPPPAMGFIKEGKLRALAVTTAQRSSALPEIPTLAEAGVPGFEFTSWWGVFGPAGLPPDVTARLNKAIVEALRAPDVKAALASFAAEPVGSSPAAFSETVKREVDKFARIVQDAHISID
ncbi:MAG TPA: tripartite tricarboxylate transporter substrate binding protein [Bordetella sp.]|nr:tripartite tricarboxylate transporter substrate binding protein [Bordetella sp.]